MFNPGLAEHRFGYGRSPDRAAPRDVDDMLARLAGTDAIAQRWPYITTSEIEAVEAERAVLAKARRQARNSGNRDEEEAAQARYKDFEREASKALTGSVIGTLGRARDTEDGFRERLVAFWADHFTTAARPRTLRYSNSAVAGEAVRPHVNGRFADMLRAAVLHPLMLTYLDQFASVGEKSVVGLRDPKKGLNENLAREVLELHTLGVGGPYSQTDVREMAKLLTGIAYRPGRGVYFDAKRAEPGAETVLGQSYGGMRTGPDAGLAGIERALDDLAHHPATARHLAQKLAIHFLSEAPSEATITAMTAAYMDNDTGLMPVYEAMLAAAEAWDPTLRNVRWPQEFIAASIRALAPPVQAIREVDQTWVRRFVLNPLLTMGQPWERPQGPDGWAEEDQGWITPLGMAGRIQWAMHTPKRIVADLPDPRDFVRTALGDAAPEAVIFAASAAETRDEAIGIILSSPAFQRR